MSPYNDPLTLTVELKAIPNAGAMAVRIHIKYVHRRMIRGLATRLQPSLCCSREVLPGTNIVLSEAHPEPSIGFCAVVG